MVRIKILSGPRQGLERQVFPGEFDPDNLLDGLVQNGWRWSIVYSEATPEEQAQWLMFDVTCRALLAQREGRPVHFNGREYPDLLKWKAVMENVGSTVSIERDDENGFWVKSVGPELKK